MLNDYQPEILETERLKRGQRRKGRILLVGTIVGAAAVYTTTQLMYEAPAPIPVAGTASLPGPTSSDPLQKVSHKLDLALPSQTKENHRDTGPTGGSTPQTSTPIPVQPAKEPETAAEPDTPGVMPQEPTLVQLPIPAEPAAEILADAPETSASPTTTAAAFLAKRHDVFISVGPCDGTVAEVCLRIVEHHLQLVCLGVGAQLRPLGGNRRGRHVWRRLKRQRWIDQAAAFDVL